MRQIARQISIDRLKQIEVVTDVRPFCPEAISNLEAVEQVKQRIAERMMIDASDVTLEIDEAVPVDVAGQYDVESKRILIRPDLVADPNRLVVVLAHELSHHALLGDADEHRIASGDEWLTELFAICSGFSVLTANVTIRTASSSDAHWSYWQTSRIGYLASSDIGYACALLARLRDESEPSWAGLLRTDAAVAFRNAMRAFPEPGVMLLDAASIPEPDSSLEQLGKFLESDQKSFQYAAIRELALRDERSPSQVAAICNLLRGRDEAMANTAAYVLGSMGANAAEAMPMLESLSSSAVDPIACSAAEAMLQIAPSEEVYSLAGEMLEQRWATSVRLASTLATHGHSAADVASYVCRRLVVALRQASDSDVEALMACLHSIHPEPVQVLETTITNEELLGWVVESIRELDATS